MLVDAYRDGELDDLEGRSLDELRTIARAIGATHLPRSSERGVKAAIRVTRFIRAAEAAGVDLGAPTEETLALRARAAEQPAPGPYVPRGVIAPKCLALAVKKPLPPLPPRKKPLPPLPPQRAQQTALG